MNERSDRAAKEEDGSWSDSVQAMEHPEKDDVQWRPTRQFNLGLSLWIFVISHEIQTSGWAT